MFMRQIGQAILEVSHKRIERPEQSVYCKHIHNHCEMLLFISGQADYNIDGQIFRPEPYDLLFIPAATYHYLIPTAPVPYENYVIGVLPEVVGEELYDRLFAQPRMLRIQEDRQLREFFARLDLYNELYSPRDFDRCAACLIRELVTYCSYRRDALNSERGGSLTHIDGIIKYIADNVTSPLDAQTIARQFMLSPSYVQNLFSQTMHIGLKKYIRQKKIYAARGDLQQGMPPGQVWVKYGFGDYSGFYRLYKNTFGCPPGRDLPEKAQKNFLSHEK